MSKSRVWTWERHVDEADKYIKTGATGQSERQLIDCVPVTPANADQFGVFGPK